MLHSLKRLTSQPIHRGQKTGQAMVEFALVITIVLMLMFGLIEAGRMLFMFTSVYAASREGARYGTAAGEGAGTANYLDCAGIAASANRAGFFANGTVTTTYDRGPGTAAIADCNTGNATLPNPSAALLTLGSRVVVTVTAQYNPLVPMPVFGNFPITSTTSRTIMREIDRLTGTLPPPPPSCGLITRVGSPVISGNNYSITLNNGMAYVDATFGGLQFASSNNSLKLREIYLNGVKVYPASGTASIGRNTWVNFSGIIPRLESRILELRFNNAPSSVTGVNIQTNGVCTP